MSKVTRPSRESLEKLTHAELVDLVLVLFDAVEQLTARVAELERRLSKNSNNSSKPPSSDGLKRKPALPRSNGQKPSGGQKGHKGQTCSWHDAPDQIEELRVGGYCACGLWLADEQETLGECRQQIDIPPPRIGVTEYRQVVTSCRCGRVYKGIFPANLPPHISYGARLKGYAVGLVQGHFISLSRVAEILNDQYGIRPSQGSIQAWINQAALAFNPAYAETQQQIIQSSVVHFDESGVRVGGKTQWLHVATTPNQAYYTVHANRGRVAMEAAGILPHFQGVAVHDHWKPYFQFGGMQHSLCNAHLLRELNYFGETMEGHQWPIQLKQILIDAKVAVKSAQTSGETQLSPDKLTELERRYDEWVGMGLMLFPKKTPPAGGKGKVKQLPATNLLLRLRDFKTEALRFLSDFAVPFDNNPAERLIRPVKVKLKVAGGFRAFGGAEAFCIIRSIWETAKLNGKNPFDSLRQAFA